MTDKVSIAIASYNGAAFIGEQLASIARQTRLPDEVVVSDDGSTDDTVAIVERFGVTAPFAVRVVRRTERLGILENFYAAFAACSGDIIVYCDQDDVWRENKLALQLAALGQGAVLTMHPSQIVDGALQPIGGQEPFNGRHGLIPAPFDSQTIYGFGHQMMFRRVVLDVMVRVRPVVDSLSKTRLAHNFDRYIPFCASLVGGVVILPEALTLFRRHADATSPAGIDTHAPVGLAARAAAAIRRDEEFAAEAAAITAEAARRSIGDLATVQALARAYERKSRLATRQAAIVGASSRVAKLARLVAALFVAARPAGFSNDRSGHAAKVAIVAALR
ncbi:glycosyltransferase [Sphingomonas sp. MMS24-J13]|uniref:glycosyltransferase n=1 Tax=Sphingomonas sp. MMS24-J13 TaxID=3238686 RepID=UPI00384DB17F